MSELTDPAASAVPTTRAERWRLILGQESSASCGALSARLQGVDAALGALYEPHGPNGLARRGGRGGSAPNVARWLGDIRRYFPASVVQVMQRDALQRLELRQMLLEKEMLENIQPDVHMVANLVALSGVIPAETKETARLVVRSVVNDLLRRLEEPMRSAVSGALDRARRNRRPRHAEIDWNRTIRANLRHWQPALRTVVPETLIGYGRKARKPQREVLLCIDQSGSMAASVVYSSIFGAVMASLPAVSTKLVVFDTEVVDMSEKLDDRWICCLVCSWAVAPTSTARSPTARPRSVSHTVPSWCSSRTCTRAAWRRSCWRARWNWWRRACSSSCSLRSATRGRLPTTSIWRASWPRLGCRHSRVRPMPSPD